MTKFLYGASVQGIQRFIFQTNDLKDIVGASELVEFICTDLFQQTVGEEWTENNRIMDGEVVQHLIYKKVKLKGFHLKINKLKVKDTRFQI